MRFRRLGLSPSAIVDSDELARDLATKSVRGGMATMVSQVLLFVIQVGGTAVLARLLTPGDYGLVGMVTVVMAFAMMFRTFGLSPATIQRASISRDQVNLLFWVNFGVSTLLTCCVLAASPLVARFYGQPVLGPVTALLSASFLLSGLTIQHDALLRRHMRLGGLSVAKVMSELARLVASVILALMGFGLWALVWGSLAAAFALSLFTFLLCPWVPGRPKRGVGVRSMIKFGANVTGFEFMNYFSRNLDNILIGRFVGVDALGYYSRAYSLFMLPITQIRGPILQIAMPGLSALSGDASRYAIYYHRMTDILATLVMPLTALVFVEADFLVRVFLGPQWGEVVPIFRVLALSGLMQGVTSTRGVVMLSTGRSDKYLRFGMAWAILVSIAFIAGLRWGAIGVATAYVTAEWLMLIPSLYYCFAGTPVSVGRFLRTLIVPGALALVAAGMSYLARDLVGYRTVLGNIVAIVVFMAAYVGASSRRVVVRDTARRVYREIPFLAKRSRFRGASNS
jgi:polysaccharide transporter, PST family